MGVYISGSGTESAPAHRYNVVQVPGRNGDLVVSDNAYENTTLTYPAFICDSIDTNLADFRAFLMSRNGYVSLTDSYHPNERRQVLFTGPFEPDMTSKLDAAQFELEFSAKPQRWLLSGDTPITVNNGDQTLQITNPTRFPAKPVITVYGTGSFNYYWRDKSGIVPIYLPNTITVTNSNSPTIIDTETGFIYYVFNGAYINCADKVTMTRDIVDISDPVRIGDVTCTKVEITPRWWTL